MARTFVRALALIAGALCVVLLVFASRYGAVATEKEPNELGRIYDSFDTLLTDLTAYSWPIDPSLATTSVFGDFRSSHFHAGIDISTRNVEGLPVMAMRNGYVSSINVSPGGYGKSVEITHDDGFTTWYAHLNRFSPALEVLVRERQQQTGRYSVEVSLDSSQVIVARGEVIAFNGSTGSGGPHLHFEIRDQNGNPVNPLLSPAFAQHAFDRTPPTLEEIGFVPLEAKSFIQGDGRAWYVRPVYRGNGEYQLPSVVHVSGSVGLTAKIRDGVGPRSFRNRVASITMFVDGAKVYVSDITRLPSKEAKQIAMHYDWIARGAGRGNHQKLFIDEGNQLPFYRRLPPGSGVIHTADLTGGSHTLDLVASDLNGNTTRLTGSFFVSQLPTVDDASTPTQPLSSSSIKYGGLERRTSNTSLQVETEFFRTFAYVHVRSSLPLTTRPRLNVMTADGVVASSVRALTSTHYFATIPLTPTMGNTLRTEAIADVNGATGVLGYDEVAIFPITAERGGVVASNDSSFVLTFKPRGVYSDLYARMEERNGVFTVAPDNVLLDEGGRVRMKVPETLLDRRTGLFHDPGAGLQLLAWRAVGSSDLLEGRVARFLGDFMILEDETPPSVSRAYVSYRSGKLTVSFRVVDSRAGVDGSTIRMTVDGAPLIPQYESEKKRIDFVGELPLAPGRHELVFGVKDKMGNLSEKTFGFWAK